MESVVKARVMLLRTSRVHGVCKAKAKPRDVNQDVTRQTCAFKLPFTPAFFAFSACGSSFFPLNAYVPSGGVLAFHSLARSKIC